MRILFVLALSLAAATLSSQPSAHHGWNWTTGENGELIGTIVSAELGNPHGILRVEVEGEEWTAEVGQPWRNERAGLRDGDLTEGAEVRLIGEVSSDNSERRIKVERLFIGDREYVLYPRRN